MRRTLNELVLEMPYSSNIEENQNNILKLLELVRQKTLEECAEKAEITSDEPYEWQQIVDEVGQCPFYVDKNSILDLPKDSIEI